MFKKLSENLAVLMAKSRINSSELARMTGVHAATIKRIRNNEQSNPTIMTLLPIAQYFSITISELLGCEILKENNDNFCNGHFQAIPVLSWRECCDFRQINYERVSKKILTERLISQKGFALVVDDPEIEFFPKNALLIIDPDLTPKANDYIIVSKFNQQEAVIKKYILDMGEVYLKSLIPGLGITPFVKEHNILGVIVQYKLELKSVERDL